MSPFGIEFDQQQLSLIREAERRDFVRRHPECTDLDAARRTSDLCASRGTEPFEPPDEVQQPDVRELHPITAEMLWKAAMEGINALA